MRAKLKNVWENMSDSLWFVPSILVTAAICLSLAMIRIDVVLAVRQSSLIPWLFSGTADAARTILSVIAGSLITVISVAFSITIVAIQQASAQFTPRVLRQFTSSRGNQIVLGTYTATFVYALLVLRSVRNPEQGPGSGFVPALSLMVAIGLALVCLGLLIYFIHHMSRSLQVAVIMDHVRKELVEQIDQLYPSGIAQGAPDPQPTASLIESLQRTTNPCYVRSEVAGFVRKIDEETLLHAPHGRVKWIWLRPQVGQFVTCGGILAELDRLDDNAAQLVDAIRDAFVVDNVRSINQDPLFGIRQLVDIALKALSPGINDMTTAEYSLAHLGDALGRLADREFPANERTTDDSQTRFIFSRPTWDEFVAAAFSQIRHEAEDDVHVTSTLLHVLHNLALQMPPGERGGAVQHQVAEIRRSIPQQSFSEADQAQLRQRADEVDHALQLKHSAWQEV